MNSPWTGPENPRFWTDPSWLVALAVGLFLRGYQFELQIVADDEWHALHAVLSSSFLGLATHFGEADRTIPLGLFFKLALHLGCLSETVMRAPSLLAGIATLTIFPLWAHKYWGQGVARAMAWLLAVSPMLIYFSRYARPYAIVGFLAFGGALAFYRWWRGGNGKWAVLYALCAIFGPYFHLTVLFFLWSPFPFALGYRMLFPTAPQPSLRNLLWLGVAVAAGSTLLLAPPLLIDSEALAHKAGQGALRLASFGRAAQLMAGSSHTGLVLGFWAFVLLGAWRLGRQNSRLLAYFAVLSAVQVGALLVSRPEGISTPIVLARYCMALLLLSLFLGSVGVAALQEALRWRPQGFGKGTFAAAVGGLFLYLGPLKEIYYYPNNFTNHALFQYHYDLDDPQHFYGVYLKPAEISEFYHQLSRFPAGSLRILEAPWYYEWHNLYFPFLQRVHRQQVVVGFVHDELPTRHGEYPPDLPGLDFRNFVHLSQEARIEELQIDYLCLHKDLNREIPNDAPRQPVEVTPWIERLTARYGQPLFEDHHLLVFGVTD